MFNDVLTFWFKDIKPAQWWQSEPAFDALISARFSVLLQQAAAGELYSWRASAAGRYPHRNAILGRASTAGELEFLKQPGSGF